MRYYFNVYDGFSALDYEGCDFPTWDEARLAAVRLAGEIFKEEPHRILSCPDWRIEVTDGNGLVLIRLDLCATDASAAKYATLS